MKKVKIVIEQDLPFSDMEEQDGDQFRSHFVSHLPDEDNGLYIKICSWDETKQHTVFNQFTDRKVKVTIETID